MKPQSRSGSPIFFLMAIMIAILIFYEDWDRDRDLNFGDRGHALLSIENLPGLVFIGFLNFAFYCLTFSLGPLCRFKNFPKSSFLLKNGVLRYFLRYLVIGNGNLIGIMKPPPKEDTWSALLYISTADLRALHLLSNPQDTS